MTCCETFAKIWMSIACLLFTLSGLTLAGFTVYSQVYLSKHLVSLAETQGLWVVFGAGLTLALLAIAVWVATCHHENKCSKVILSICATIVLILIIAIGAAAVVFLLWTNNKAGDLDTYLVEGIDATVGRVCCETASATNGTFVGPKPICNTTVLPENCAPEICQTEFSSKLNCFDNQIFALGIKNWISNNMKWVGIAALIVGLFDLGSFIMMCVLVCKKSHNDNYYTNYHTSGSYY